MKPLFVFEMANNHMGDVDHGVRTIRAIREACEGFDDCFDFAFKLQYRDLDTFIHASMRGRDDVKYIKRFEETRLSDEAFRTLVAEMETQGFRTVCTPFDERSVDRIDAHGIDTIKIASCSFTDWPLLERIARADKPVIASTAGSTLEEIDNVVSFFLHRGKDLTLMHCVAEYPTPDEALQVNQIGLLRERYPDCRIGYSTHESPDNTVAVMLAMAKGATVFEKHVVLPTERYPANAYSADPRQIRDWLAAARRALQICGSSERYVPSAAERASLTSLRRGVFALRAIPAGAEIDDSMIEIAFPPSEGQLTANDWSKYSRFVAREAIPAGGPVMHAAVEEQHLRGKVLQAVTAVKALLKAGNIVVPGKSDLEISHHYGMERFSEFGLTMVTVVNREYCKKLLVMLPGQTHPEQYHEQKEETFVVLHGDLTLWLDNEQQRAKAGDVITVNRGVRHKFHTEGGAVFEEISSTHYKDDSFYTDPAIAQNPRRKTWLTYWM
ncbi:N-acetylneuraminate synthase family protein [Azoarcus sp. KH32C]|uniref:N-acetylneuraminate synthase family protein n=1 Tax=Azoarcus sp. KH32C TaxID=748247 RepID=UPI0002386929|nr:N-acetylneuraminate synthase family protein [Azoarcus sp. KH32C]BAL23761.1 N-acetylneuraminic acid synthase domain protein [Azoarcus sp. KH32C]